MAIEIDPALEQELEDRIAKLQAENAQFAEAILRTQDRLTGASPPPPGLEAEDDVNIDLQAKLNAAIAPFEDERKAVDGRFPNPPVTAADIEAAASNQRPNTLFPITNLTIDPSFIDPLKGLGGIAASNEDGEKAKELTALATLLPLLPLARVVDPAFADWQLSLTLQSVLLTTQITAGTGNAQYGASHPDVIAAGAEKTAVDALLPTPPNDTAALTARQTQASTRKAFLPTRITTLLSDVTPLYDQRFLVINSRVNTARGTRSGVLTALSKIPLVQGFIDLNNELIAFYTSALP